MNEKNLVSFIGEVSGYEYIADMNLLRKGRYGERYFEYALCHSTGTMRTGTGYNGELTSPASNSEIKLYNSILKKSKL